MLKETQRNRPGHTQRDTCRNMCIPEDTPRKRHPQKDGVRGPERIRATETCRDVQMVTERNSKAETRRETERKRYVEICTGRDRTV